MKTRFLSILSTFALSVCTLAQPFVKNTVTTNEVVSGVLTPAHNLVTVRTNFTVTGTQNVNDLQASTLTITNSWNAIGATNMLMANMRSSTNATLSIGVSNIYAGGELSWPTGHVAYLFATNANYGSANVTNLYTLITNSPALGTDANGKLIISSGALTNPISATYVTSGTNDTASIGAAEFVAGRMISTNATQTNVFSGLVEVKGVDSGVRVFTVMGNTGLLTVSPYVNSDLGAQLVSVNTAGNAYLPLTFAGSTFYFSNGNVGIGTNAPGWLLTVADTAPTADEILLGVQSAGSTVFSVDENGAVTNAGTLTPLQGMSASYLSSGTNNTASVGFGTLNVSNTTGGITATGLVHTIQAGSANTLVVTNGSVGIGTASPGADLQIGSYTDTVDRKLSIIGESSAAGATLRLADVSDSYGFDIVNYNTGGLAYLGFARHQNGPAQTAMAIERDTGHVGINTNAPGWLLTVANTAPTADEILLGVQSAGSTVFSVDENGAITNQGTLTAWGAIGANCIADTWLTASNNGTGYLQRWKDGTGTMFVYGGAAGGFEIGTSSAHDLAFDTATTVRMKVQNSSGGVLVGQPFSASIAPTDGMIIAGALGVGKATVTATLDVTNRQEQSSVFRVDTTAGQNSFLVQSNGNTYFGGTSNHVAGSLVASNLTFLKPRWVDANFSGLNFGANPSANPPSRVEVEGGTGIYGLAWEHDDNASFSAEVQHGVASTNANFPDFYYEPHLHLSASTVPANTSNATFRITFQVSNAGGSYSNSIVTLTNTVAFTYPSQHKMLDFGEVTNNLLSGADALIFRGTVTRLATNENGVYPGDLGNTATVFIDTFGFHIPANEYGSALINGDSTP